MRDSIRVAPGVEQQRSHALLCAGILGKLPIDLDRLVGLLLLLVKRRELQQRIAKMRVQLRRLLKMWSRVGETVLFRESLSKAQLRAARFRIDLERGFVHLLRLRQFAILAEGLSQIEVRPKLLGLRPT